MVHVYVYVVVSLFLEGLVAEFWQFCMYTVCFCDHFLLVFVCAVLCGEDLSLAEQLEDLKEELEELKASSSSGTVPGPILLYVCF